MTRKLQLLVNKLFQNKFMLNVPPSVILQSFYQRVIWVQSANERFYLPINQWTSFNERSHQKLTCSQPNHVSIGSVCVEAESTITFKNLGLRWINFTTPWKTAVKTRKAEVYTMAVTTYEIIERLLLRYLNTTLKRS